MREVNERLDTLLRMGEKMKLLPPEDEARFKKLMKK